MMSCFVGLLGFAIFFQNAYKLPLSGTRVTFIPPILLFPESIFVFLRYDTISVCNFTDFYFLQSSEFHMFYLILSVCLILGFSNTRDNYRIITLNNTKVPNFEKSQIKNVFA